jgi:hypothetical protein
MTTLNTPAGPVTCTATVDDVKKIYAECRERFGAEHALQGTRAQMSELVQALCPPPTEEDVTDAHVLAAAKARKTDPHVDTLHWLQKRHGAALWAEVDRLIAASGVVTP